MIDPDLTVGRQADDTPGASDRLLGTVTRPLPPSQFQGLPNSDRISVLLERLMSVAGAGSGAVLLTDDNGQLVAASTLSLDERTQRTLPATPDSVPFGLTVRAPVLGPHPSSTSYVAAGDSPAQPDAADDLARMILWLPLEAGDQLRGCVRLGFTEYRPLEAADLQRLTLIADHITLISEADRLARENERCQLEIARVSAELNEIDRLKGEFLAMISHELRTPLTAIIGYTDLLLRQIHGPLNDRQSRHQEAVKKAAHRLLALINDLLDVNRLESGQIALDREPLSLPDAVRRATAQIEHTAELQGVALRLDMPAGHITVLADHERLHQILINLLDNAVKFTPPTGTVTVRIDQRGDAASVAVVDTGIGVAPEQLERIWDRFHRADSSVRRHFGGTGLGLAIVRHLVEGHGGSVSVASQGIGMGSTFSFTLPAVASAAQRRAFDGRPVAASAGQRRTVLIVEDEPDNREVIRMVVEDILGHEAVTAADGREALARVHPGVDLILLDLRMPGLSGFDVARELKEHGPTSTIPILAISAVDDPEKLASAREAGCVGCITKPFAQEALAEAISSAFASVGSGAAG